MEPPGASRCPCRAGFLPGHLTAACSAPAAVRSCHHPLLGKYREKPVPGLEAGAGPQQGRGAEPRGWLQEELQPGTVSPAPAERGRRAHPAATCDFTEQKCAGKLLGARAGPSAQLRAIAARLCADVRPSPGSGQGAQTVSGAVSAPADPGRFPHHRVRASEPGRELSGRAGGRSHRSWCRGQEGASSHMRSVPGRLLPAAQLENAVTAVGLHLPQQGLSARPFPWIFSPRHPGSARAGGEQEEQEPRYAWHRTGAALLLLLCCPWLRPEPSAPRWCWHGRAPGTIPPGAHQGERRCRARGWGARGPCPCATTTATVCVGTGWPRPLPSAKLHLRAERCDLSGRARTGSPAALLPPQRLRSAL